MFKYIALLALVVPAILATEGVGPCRNGAYAPTVNVAGCDRTPCPVPLNSEANMQVQFVARKLSMNSCDFFSILIGNIYPSSFRH